MQNEFRGKSLAEVVGYATGRISKKSSQQESTCHRINEEMQQLQRKTIDAMDDIESISDDLKRRIEELGNDDRWAKVNIGVDLTLALTGVGGVIIAARKIRSIGTAMGSLYAAKEIYDNLDVVIDKIDDALYDIGAIKEAADIGSSLQLYRRSKYLIESARERMKELIFAYENHECIAVFGRDF